MCGFYRGDAARKHGQTRWRASTISSMRCHLHDADGGVDVGEAVVETETGMGQPTNCSGIAALVAQKLRHMSASFLVVCHHHAAFAGGDLLVGVEAEDAAAAESSDLAFFVGRAGRLFAGIFDEGDFMAGGELGNVVHAGGVAEGFDAEDGLGFWRDGFGGFFGVHVEGGGFDVGEDRRGADHFDGVAGGDEGEGSGDDSSHRRGRC